MAGKWGGLKMGAKWTQKMGTEMGHRNCTTKGAGSVGGQRRGEGGKEWGNALALGYTPLPLVGSDSQVPFFEEQVSRPRHY